MISFSCNVQYNVTNPFEWMDMISLQGKTNFFEKRVGDYQKVRVCTLFKVLHIARGMAPSSDQSSMSQNVRWNSPGACVRMSVALCFKHVEQVCKSESISSSERVENLEGSLI
jgi:hypothetical protein